MNTFPLTINGSQGEGGGQVLRTAVALSMCTRQPVRIDNIRAGRRKPGLMRQHLTAVRAAAEVCAARVEGDAVGSCSLTFEPGDIKAGAYHFAVGTAGSATLVLQTVLPALLCADGDSELTLEGGTHNPWAPPFDFLAKTFIPVINRLGPTIEVTLERAGFYPAGGGRMTVHIQPTQQLNGLDLLHRGEIMKRSARALIANLSANIAERELKVAARMTNWDAACFHVQCIADSPGPGNVLMLELECEHITELFTAFGEHGTPAERVAEQAVRDMRQYLAADVPVGLHLADQLLLPLVLAARQGRQSTFHTLPLSRHALTQVELIRQFTDVPIEVAKQDGNRAEVTIG